MKIIKDIQDSVIGRVPITRPLMKYTETAETDERHLHVETHERRRMEIKLEVVMIAPPDATQELRRRAARLFLHELYGEVADEIHAVLRDLYQQEPYHAPGDPVAARLHSLLAKLEGWNL